jgi:cysteine synthase A
MSGNAAAREPGSRQEAPWLVAVCAGRWQENGIRRARDAGLRVLALDGDARAPGLALADRSKVVDVRDPARVLEAVREAGIQPSGAIAFAAEAGMEAVGALRDAYRLPGPGQAVLRRLTNKILQRDAWQKAGLPNPFWRPARNAAEAAAALDEAGRPAIVKPVDAAGSRGVTRIDPNEPWEEAVARAFTASRCAEIVIESLLPGTEYTVETFAHNGETTVLAVTEKRKVPGTGGTVADELATPELAEPGLRRIAETAVAALAAVGYDAGPGHVEVMYDEAAGPGLIEAAGRGAGFMMFDGLVPRASGYDLATATALQAVGRRPPPVPEARRAVLLRFFPTSPGIVRRIEGMEVANAIEGIEAGAFVTVGTRVGAARADGDRLGYLLAHGATPAKARERADAAEARVRFDIEPLPHGAC